MPIIGRVKACVILSASVAVATEKPALSEVERVEGSLFGAKLKISAGSIVRSFAGSIVRRAVETYCVSIYLSKHNGSEVACPVLEASQLWSQQIKIKGN